MDFEIPNRAEALLIATVNPISKAEISKILGIEEKETARILRVLRKRSENTALELKMIGRKYKIGVRDSYSDIAFQYSES
jgi:chromosome segregation and condensation protein ScpB